MEEQILEIGDYVDILKRRKWSLVLPAVLVMLLAGVVALMLPSIYKSTATILIEEQDIPADFVMSTVTGYAEQRIQSTQQRIMSSTRLMEIVNRFGLYKEYEDRWTTEQLIEKMREDIHLELISVDTVDRRTGRATVATIAFTLSYEGKQASVVQRVTDTLVSLFLSENLQVRQRQTTETTEFIEEEAQRVRSELDELEKKISAFKEVHINSLPEMIQVNIRSLDNYESSADRIEEQIRMLKEREGYLETQLVSIPETENTEKQRMRQLELELVDLKTRFTEDYPDVKKLKREIAELKRRIAEKSDLSGSQKEAPDNTAYITLASQLSSTRAEIKSLSQQKADLMAKVESYRQRIENTPKIEQEYNAMVLDRNNTQAKYEDLLRKNHGGQCGHGAGKGTKRGTLHPDRPRPPSREALQTEPPGHHPDRSGARDWRRGRICRPSRVFRPGHSQS
jgi:succinoglycan biosynthesis transport protein ExoP